LSHCLKNGFAGHSAFNRAGHHAIEPEFHYNAIASKISSLAVKPQGQAQNLSAPNAIPSAHASASADFIKSLQNGLSNYNYRTSAFFLLI
jgi:fatty acid/phospholipid biosynthesis enzyme